MSGARLLCHRPGPAWSTALLALPVVLTLATPAAAQETPAGEPAAVPATFRFGDYQGTIDRLADPSRVAVAADGRIFVAEAGRGRIRIFDAGGETRGQFGSPGSGPGQLVAPRGLALAADGTIFVADTGNHRVQHFDASGAVLGAWGGYGVDPGRFNQPQGIAVDGQRVYVADVGNDRIQVFDHDGTFRVAIGSHGSEDGQFNRPLDVAADETGAIYVADTDNNRIQKFDAGGAFVRAWGDWGPFSGLLDEPSGLTWSDGELYVVDTRNHRVQIFDGDGELRFQWGKHAVDLHEGDGLLHYPNDVAIAPDKTFGVLCEAFENRLQIFAAVPAGVEPSNPGSPIPPRGTQSHFGERLAIQEQLLTMAEPDTHRLVLFELSKEIPIVIGAFGDRGTGFGQLIRPTGLELDVPGRTLYMSDTATRRVQTYRLDYDPDDARRYSPFRGKFARSFDLAHLHETVEGVELPWVITPTAIRRDTSGNLFVVDARNSMILVFDADLQFVRGWGGYGSEPGTFNHPVDLAFSRDGGSVFVVDANNHRVQVFDTEGRFKHAWGTAGDGPGQFRQAFGITAGRDGFVYVSDAAANRIQKFAEDGTFVTTWGELGPDHGQFWKPRGVAQDQTGRVFVIDRGNHRAQIFSPEGEWLVTFGMGRAYTPERVEAMKKRKGVGK